MNTRGNIHMVPLSALVCLCIRDDGRDDGGARNLGHCRLWLVLHQEARSADASNVEYFARSRRRARGAQGYALAKIGLIVQTVYRTSTSMRGLQGEEDCQFVGSFPIRQGATSLTKDLTRASSSCAGSSRLTTPLAVSGTCFATRTCV